MFNRLSIIEHSYYVLTEFVILLRLLVEMHTAVFGKGGAFGQVVLAV